MTDARQLSEQMFAVIDGQRWHEFGTVMEPDVVFTSPFGELHGIDAWIEFSSGFAGAVPDGRHIITDVIQDGDRGAIQGYWTGTNTGPVVTPQGVSPATGRTVRVTFAGWGYFPSGKMAAVTVYLDQLSMLGQLGLLPEPVDA